MSENIRGTSGGNDPLDLPATQRKGERPSDEDPDRQNYDNNGLPCNIDPDIKRIILSLRERDGHE
ncbi:MAG: hypothetical protein ACOCUO_02985 [archaeon]